MIFLGQKMFNSDKLLLKPVNPFCILNYPFLAKKTEFKEFEPRLNFDTRLKYCWFRHFHLELYSIFQDLSRRSNRCFANSTCGLNSLSSDSG